MPDTTQTEIQFSPSEVAALLSAVTSDLRSRMRWAISRHPSWENVEWATLYVGIQSGKDAFYKLLMAINDDPGAYVEDVAKLLGLDEAEQDLLSDILTAESWAEVPDHRNHQCRFCT